MCSCKQQPAFKFSQNQFLLVLQLRFGNRFTLQLNLKTTGARKCHMWGPSDGGCCKQAAVFDFQELLEVVLGAF